MITVNEVTEYYNNTVTTFDLVIDQNINIMQQLNQNMGCSNAINKTVCCHLNNFLNIAQRKKQHYESLLDYIIPFNDLNDLMEDLKEHQQYCYQLCRDEFFDTFNEVLKIDFLNEKEKIKHFINYYTAKNNKPVTTKFLKKDPVFFEKLYVKDLDKFTLYDLILVNPDIIKTVATKCTAWKYLTSLEKEEITRKYPHTAEIIKLATFLCSIIW